jgi:phospholipid-translocating ATPase
MSTSKRTQASVPGRHTIPILSAVAPLTNKALASIKSSAALVYQRTIVELILRQKHIEASTDGRHIPLRTHHDKPLIDTRRGHAYISNNVRTSRYTVWDFVPKQLFFQLTRVANFYFLCVGIPQTVRSPLLSYCASR